MTPKARDTTITMTDNNKMMMIPEGCPMHNINSNDNTTNVDYDDDDNEPPPPISKPIFTIKNRGQPRVPKNFDDNPNNNKKKKNLVLSQQQLRQQRYRQIQLIVFFATTFLGFYFAVYIAKTISNWLYGARF